ncbi:mitogen-activated protein kinase kinase kinase dlk-1-like [Hydra vulgaris]|uniref:Mitogen-activated protein kinase kinase kinase dlk-1-like n=1 Tax=Hydra vulgaris TaxID=6087 RepID=A0ABM4B1C8_HYDVU
MCINLKKLRHVNVFQFKGYCLRPSIIGFEYCCVKLNIVDDVNNLSQLIAVLNSDNTFELNERLNYIFQVLNGLAYLHQENIHCDLKPCNMLVKGKSEKDLVIKIADFDELLRLKQTFTSSCTTYSNFRGMPLSYTAPELCLCIVQRPSKESNIYSFGVSAFEILSDASA